MCVYRHSMDMHGAPSVPEARLLAQACLEMLSPWTLTGWAHRTIRHPPGSCSARPDTPPARFQPMLEADSGLSSSEAPSRVYWFTRPLATLLMHV